MSRRVGPPPLGIVMVLAAVATCGWLAPAAAAVPAGAVLVATEHGSPPLPNARRVARIGDITYSAVPVPAARSAASHLRRLARRAGVIGAQLNTPIPRAASIAGTCVDPPTAVQFGIPTTVKAANRPLPARTRPVAILDTGVDPAVRELAGRVLPASDAIGGPATGLADDDGHGTQVAAAAAGAAGRVAGVSPTSVIMPVRIATASQLATPASIVKGIEIAVQRRARVIVLPFSQPLTQTADGTVDAVGLAVNTAFDSGAITVTAAGNEGSVARSFPGVLAHVLTVGSSGPLAVRDPFSNIGPWVDLVAPGGDLVLPAPAAVCSTGYATANGTSFSAGVVGGAVALISAARPSLQTNQVFDLVRRRASRDAGLQGYDINTGFGLLDVGAGLSSEAPAIDPREVNDNVHWLKRSPARFPTYLRRTRQTTTRGAVSPGKDPQDAFKVYLRRNDLIRVRVKSSNSAALLDATLWDPRTGPFDMRLFDPRTQLREDSGFTQNPEVRYRARRGGTYYVAVFAPDRRLPDETGGGGSAVIAAPPLMRYALTFDRSCSSSRTVRVPLARLRRPGRTMRGLVVYVDGARRSVRDPTTTGRRIRLHALRNGSHRIVFKATFANSRRTSHATRIKTRCKLQLAR